MVQSTSQTMLIATPPQVIFGSSNSPNGWLNMHSPYGYRYLGHNWKSIAHAWYAIVHNICDNKYSQGRYATRLTEMNDEIKYNHLIDITTIVVTTHPILQTYLLETGYSRIVYSISKYASVDQKWLGYVLNDNVGYNYLGRAWMDTRRKLRITSEKL